MVVDLGLALILVLAPFLMGGETSLGQISLCLLSTFVAFVWCLHQCVSGDGRWRFTGVEPIMLLGVGLIILQCWELTPELVRALSPRVPRLLTEWTETSSLFAADWNRISFTPLKTWSDLITLMAAMEFFFVLVQRLQSVEDVSRYVRHVAVGGAGMSLFGLVQMFWGNGKFFWFVDAPFPLLADVAQGAFTRAEHFALYIALTIPAQLILFYDSLFLNAQGSDVTSPRDHGRDLLAKYGRPAFWGCCLGVTVLALLYSRSTCGTLSAVVGSILSLLILWQKSMLSLKQAGTGVAFVGLVLLAVPLMDRPSEPVVDPLANLPHLAAMSPAPAIQRDPWKANVVGIREFPLAGTGLGSQTEVIGLWLHRPAEVIARMNFENGYLQLALETGLTGLGLAILLWLTSLLWCAQGLWNSVSPRAGGLMAVAASGLVMSLIQSGYGAIWYIPACMNIVLLYGVAAWRISLMRFFESGVGLQRPIIRKGIPWGWMAAMPVVLLLGTWMVRESWPALAAEPIWNDYLRLTVVQQELEESEQGGNRDLLEQRIQLARKAAELNPKSHDVQLHAGLACLKAFMLNQSDSLRQMPLSQIRDAARTLFDSKDEMDLWLNRPGVLGSDRALLEQAIQHFQASLTACPLQPRPYLELAELVWLTGGTETDERQLVEQAVAVRPGDARTQFAMGRILWLEGAQKEAALHWQNAFRLDTEYRSQLIGVLSEYVPARFFLDHFEPDHAALKQLRSAYRDTEDLLGYQQILDHLGRSSIRKALALRGEPAATEWMLAHDCFSELGDRKNAYHAAKEAVVSAPDCYAAHEVFGLWLYRNGMFPEAVRELTWCLKQKPEETWLQTIAVNAQEQLSPASPPRTQYAEQPGDAIVR